MLIDSDEYDASSSDEQEPIDPEYVDCPDKEQDDEIYPREKRRKIVAYWWNNGNKRKFSSVTNTYRLLADKDEKLLYNWKERFSAGSDSFSFSLF